MQRWLVLCRAEDPAWTKRETEEESRLAESYTAVLQTSNWFLTGAFEIKNTFGGLCLFIEYYIYSQSVTLRKNVLKGSNPVGKSPVKVRFPRPSYCLCCVSFFYFTEQLWQCIMCPSVSCEPLTDHFFWKNPMIEACLDPLLPLELVFFWLFFSSGLLPVAGFAGKGSLGACLVAAESSSASEYDSLS